MLLLDLDSYIYLITFIFIFFTAVYFIGPNPLVSVSSLRSFFKISKKNRNVVLFVTYVYVTLVFCPYLDDIFNDLLDNDPFFFVYVTLFGLTFNIINSKYTNDYKFLDFSFFKNFYRTNVVMFFKSIFIKLRLDKFILFFYDNVLLVFFKIFKKLYRYVSSFFIAWIPLFKKSSYYAFYKSFISKFK
jgi:hypothetical protein